MNASYHIPLESLWAYAKGNASLRLEDRNHLWVCLHCESAINICVSGSTIEKARDEIKQTLPTLL